MSTLDSDLTPSTDDEFETEPLPLPRRRRLPLLTAALALAVVAGGAFVGGIEMQKHQGGSSSRGGNGTASAFAARLGRDTTTGATTTGTTASGATGTRGGAFGGGATIGTVTAIKGSTLYITDTSGNTVKVATSPSSSVTKTVSSSVKGINPGDTVVVRGSQGTNGTVTAESISVGTAGGFGGGSSDNGGATGFGGSSSGSSNGNSNGGATGFGGGGG